MADENKDGWENAKEAAGCLLWVLVFMIIIVGLTALPKILDAIKAWNP